MNADNAQLAAIKHGGGPALVCAGPGSGKTFVLTRRVQYLIQIPGVPPKEILVLTFSKKAAAEMKERFLQLTEAKETEVTFGTFHAVFLKFLRFYAPDKHYRLMDEAEKRRLLRTVLKENGIQIDYPEFLSEILFDIQSAKDKNNVASKALSKHLTKEVFARVFSSYEEHKKVSGWIDFDDILYETADLLKRRPDLLAVLQERFGYVLIDEFQDINPVQYEIVCKICERHRNLFAVGDDDQSIYSFRGALPSVMLGFKNEYPNVREIHLTRNYRCGSRIVDAAGRLIVHNSERIEKEISASSGKEGEVIVKEFLSSDEQYEYLCEILKRLNEEELAKTAILNRTNEIHPKLLHLLRKNNIPFRFSEKTGSVYDRFVGRDIEAYLSMATGVIKRDDFLRVMNRPNRYVPANLVRKEILNIDRMADECREKTYLRENLLMLKRNLENMGRFDPYAAVVYLKKAVGYEKYLSDRFGDGDREDAEDNLAMDDLITITEEAKKFHTIPEFLEEMKHTRDLLSGKVNHASKAGEERRNERITGDDKDNKGVVIMTMHASKGLEFDRVFLPNLIEGVMPIKQAEKKQEIEEERRMLYVAMTRAKEKLYLLTISEKNPFEESGRGRIPFGFQKEQTKTGQTVPSRFLREIINR